MKYSTAINMAITAVSMDRTLEIKTKQEIIETLAEAEESANIGLAFQKYGNYFGVDVDEVVEFAESEGEE